MLGISSEINEIRLPTTINNTLIQYVLIYIFEYIVLTANPILRRCISIAILCCMLMYITVEERAGNFGCILSLGQ